MLPHMLANWQRFLIVMGGSVLVVACLYAAKAILLPLILALLLAFVLSPVVTVLQKLRIGRVFSVLLTTGITFTVLVVFVWIFTQQLADLARELPKHKEEIVAKIAALRSQEQNVVGNILSFVQEVVEEMNKQLSPGREARPQPVNVVVDESSARLNIGWISVLIGPILDVVLGGVFIIVLVIMMLISRENLRNRIIRLVGHGQLFSTTKLLDDVAHRISDFLFLQAAVNILFGTLLGVGLFFIGVPYASFFALISAVLRFVPYLGTATAAGILLICEIAIFPDWTECLLTLTLFALLELLTAYAVEPLLFGREMGISPVALLVAAAFWSWLWGPLGLLLSTPMTVCLVVLGKYVPNLGFLNVLLGDEPVLTDQFRYYQRLLARDQDEAINVVENYLQRHNVESVYDDILIPALILTKRDVSMGHMTVEQAAWMHQMIRESMEEYVVPRQDQIEEPDGTEASKMVVLGCAAHDKTDELALEMLAGLLQVRNVELKMLTSKALVSEVTAAIHEESPTAVVIAALPSGGLAHSYYLCKKLRAEHPPCRIIVGRWGLTENIEEARQRARTEGADEFHVQILETAESIRSSPEKKAEVLPAGLEKQPLQAASTTEVVGKQSLMNEDRQLTEQTIARH